MPPDAAEFDTFAADYDAALNEGLSVSGEDKNYFARGRVEWLRRCLSRLDFSPRRILDFGCGTGSATPFFLTRSPVAKCSAWTSPRVRSKSRVNGTAPHTRRSAR